MYCKFCGTQLEDGTTVCTNCGETLEKPKKQIKLPKIKISKKALIIAAASLAAVGIIVGAVFGLMYLFRPNDVHYKDSYTVANDKISPDTVVATIGDAKLTNGQLQIFYWTSVLEFLQQNGNYLSYYGLDYTKPLDQQIYSKEKDLTWQQYFLEEALNSWQYYQALYLEAEKAGYEPPEVYEEYFEKLHGALQESATKYKFDSVDALLQADFGAGTTYNGYEYHERLYYMGNLYFSELSGKIEVTDAEIEAYFEKNKESLAAEKITKESGDLVDVRHILITPEGGTKSEDGKTTTYSDAEWEACRKKAQDILDKWLAGEKTEDSFAKLAQENSTDPGSKDKGGLYTYIYKGQMVKPFEEWCFAEGRKTGDYGLVKTDYGYHVMYFVFGEPGWIRYSRSNLISERATDMLMEIAGNYERVTDYKLIALPVSDLNK